VLPVVLGGIKEEYNNYFKRSYGYVGFEGDEAYQGLCGGMAGGGKLVARMKGPVTFGITLVNEGMWCFSAQYRGISTQPPPDTLPACRNVENQF